MKATKVTFSRTVSRNYQSSSLGVELLLEEGETVEDALAVATVLVSRGLDEEPLKLAPGKERLEARLAKL